jgi:hypothetical protein
MVKDWAGAIREARLRGVDLTAEMTDADWSEYRAQCRSWLDGTPEGQAHKQRAVERIAAKRAVIDPAS